MLLTILDMKPLTLNNVIIFLILHPFEQKKLIISHKAQFPLKLNSFTYINVIVGFGMFQAKIDLHYIISNNVQSIFPVSFG